MPNHPRVTFHNVYKIKCLLEHLLNTYTCNYKKIIYAKKLSEIWCPSKLSTSSILIRQTKIAKMQSKKLYLIYCKQRGVGIFWTCKTFAMGPWINLKRQVSPLAILLSFRKAVHPSFMITILLAYSISTFHSTPSSLTNLIFFMFIMSVCWANLNGIA